MAQKIVNKPVLSPPPNPMSMSKNFEGMNQLPPSKPVPMTQAAYQYQKTRDMGSASPSTSAGSVHRDYAGRPIAAPDPYRYMKKPK